EITLDHEAAADQCTHQVPDSAVLPKRDQRPEITIVPGTKRPARKSVGELPGKVGGLLMGRLRPRGHEAILFRPRARGAITDSEDGLILGCLQRLADQQLVEAVGA